MIQIKENRQVLIYENNELVKHSCTMVENHYDDNYEYYDWCAILEDGTLIWGEEQGNYAGGVLVYPDMDINPMFSHTSYEKANRRNLEDAQANHPEYYEAIVKITKTKLR
jgi:hypothetical protein